MKYFIEILIFFTLGLNPNITFDNDEIKHKVSVLHPGISLTDSVEQVLYEVLPSQSSIHEYYMEVETVVCGNDQCRIDMVKIYWNDIGMFDRLVVPQGIYLEKAEGKFFTQEDYKKLHNILSNQDASLEDVGKYEVVGRETSDGLDGMTGATILLNTNDYVQGAVWTCYTLWHWVHGGIHRQIRDITGNNMKSEDLLNLLAEGNENHQVFAIEQLHRNKIYQAKFVDQMTQSIIHQPLLLKDGLKYLKELPPDSSNEVFIKLFTSINESKRSECLSLLKESKQPTSLQFIEQISLSVCDRGSFEELNLLLSILEDQPSISQSTKNQLFPILRQDNFISARLVFWFLKEQSLTSQQEKDLQLFFKENSHRL